MMKRLALVLVVLFLCEVMSTEAARGKPGRARNQKRVMCGGKLCAPGEFCGDFIDPPQCARTDPELVG
uniref:Putative conserved secreted protein fat body overexpressed n=1 Tax=Rhipicephalus microplus TaxID=6941 RepID=A0A6M2D4J4_RHIMP